MKKVKVHRYTTDGKLIKKGEEEENVIRAQDDERTKGKTLRQILLDAPNAAKLNLKSLIHNNKKT